MSRENVEVVRRALEASTRRDNEATFALYDPEVEIYGQVDGAVYRGLTGVRVFFRDWFAAWSELSYDAEEWIDAGTSGRFAAASSGGCGSTRLRPRPSKPWA